MSADNWGICAHCYREALEERDELLKRVDAVYGRIPLNEFDALREKADEEVDEDKFRTLREDYELGLNEDGKFYVYYKGRCQTCAFGTEFRHEEQVME